MDSNTKTIDNLDTNFCEHNIFDNFDNTCNILDDNNILNNTCDNNNNNSSGGPGNKLSEKPIKGGTDSLQRFFRRKQQQPQTATLKFDDKQQFSEELTEQQKSIIGDNKIIENLCDGTTKKLIIQHGATGVAAATIDCVQKTSSLNRIFNRKSSIAMNEKVDNKKQSKRRPQTATTENDSTTQQKSRFRNYLNYYWNSLFRKGLPKTSTTDLGSPDAIKNNEELHKAGESIFENINKPLPEAPADIIEICLTNDQLPPVAATL